MGMGLRDLDGLSMREFSDLTAAWNATQNPDEPAPMTSAEEDALAAMLGV